MYETMASITLVLLWIILSCEIIYHGRILYKRWLDNHSIYEYQISYDPFLKNNRHRDGMDWFMAIFFGRLLAGGLGSIILAFMWPITLFVLVLIGGGKYHKYIYQLKKQSGDR